MAQPKEMTTSEYQSAYQKARNERLAADNRCRRCENKLKAADRPRVNCADCRVYFAERAAARYETNRPTKPVAASKTLTVAENVAQRRAAAKAKGLCGMCSTRKPSKGFLTCDECREAAKRAYEKRKIVLAETPKKQKTTKKA